MCRQCIEQVSLDLCSSCGVPWNIPKKSGRCNPSRGFGVFSRCPSDRMFSKLLTLSWRVSAAIMQRNLIIAACVISFSCCPLLVTIGEDKVAAWPVNRDPCLTPYFPFTMELLSAPITAATKLHCNSVSCSISPSLMNKIPRCPSLRIDTPSLVPAKGQSILSQESTMTLCLEVIILARVAPYSSDISGVFWRSWSCRAKSVSSVHIRALTSTLTHTEHISNPGLHVLSMKTTNVLTLNDFHFGTCYTVQPQSVENRWEYKINKFIHLTCSL